jgi:hypothetical protein
MGTTLSAMCAAQVSDAYAPMLRQEKTRTALRVESETGAKSGAGRNAALDSSGFTLTGQGIARPIPPDARRRDCEFRFPTYCKGENNMARRVLAAFVLVTFASIAYGQQPAAGGGSGKSLHCNNGNCKLEVTVTDGGCANPNNINVLPDPLLVPKGNPNKIEWTITTSGFTWVPAPGGITGLPNPPFHDPHVTGGGKKYDLKDDNEDVKEYKYAIHLLDANGNPCAVKDPIIRNGN